MRGGQDLGGMHGLGPIVREENEPAFHSDWERRCFALTLAMGATGAWNIDESRHARENRHPADYMKMSYYEIWLAGLEKLLDAHRLGAAHAPDPDAVSRRLAAENVDRVLAAGGPSERDAPAPPVFAEGDLVKVGIFAGPGHTRAPGYVQGRQGIVEHHHGAHVFPDTNAHGRGESPRHLYTVSFSATDLFGETARQGDRVQADLWEPYLEAARP